MSDVDSQASVRSLSACLQVEILSSLSELERIVQVILAFSSPFWPDGFFDVVCTDCFIPEFWVTSYSGITGASPALYCMVGFVAGQKAEDMSNMRPSNIISNTLNQLDQMFGEHAANRCLT